MASTSEPEGLTHGSAGEAARGERADLEEDTVLRERPSTLGAESAGPAGPGTEHPEADLEDTVIGLIQPHAPASDRAVLSLSPSSQPSTPSTPTAPLPSQEIPPSPAAPEPPPAPIIWAARIRGTDVTIPLDRPAVIGRHPGAARIDEVPHPRRVQIPAEHRDVSARHARVEQLGDTLVVTDLGSTNGIDVHWSQGSVRRLRPGETSVVLPDAVVAIGDAVVVEFVAAATP